MPSKIDEQTAYNNVMEICYNNNIILHDFVYIGSLKTYLKLTLPCGCYTDTTTYAKFISKKGVQCRKCLGISKYSQEEANFKVGMQCLMNNYRCDKFKYIGTDKTYLYITCHCGYKWNSTTFSEFIGGSGCPKCSGNIMYTQEEAEHLVLNKCNEYGYTYKPFVYIGTDNTYLDLTCDIGHNWCSTNFFHYIHQGTKCPECNSTESYKLVDIIDPLFSVFEKEKRFDDCINIRPLPFDRYIPELNLLIEYDGEQHFEYKEFIHKEYRHYESMKLRDSIKTNYAIGKGYNFIRIAYYENCYETLSHMIKLIKNSTEQVVKIYGKIM